jgi:TetR/AcrR family transcriptional regulator
MPATESKRTRDAERSRTAILEAGERVFAERGYEGASLGDIAELAGVSRATPSYFFGSKEELYVVVLEQVFQERQSAAVLAFKPLHAWVHDGGGRDALRRAFEHAADGYLKFLLARPAFVRLLQHEDLAGGRRLRVTPRERNAMAVAFDALRQVAHSSGIGSFDVNDAVLLFVSLTFSPLTQQSTFMAVLGHDLRKRATRRRHVQLVADQLLHLVSSS